MGDQNTASGARTELPARWFRRRRSRLALKTDDLTRAPRTSRERNEPPGRKPNFAGPPSSLSWPVGRPSRLRGRKPLDADHAEAMNPAQDAKHQAFRKAIEVAERAVDGVARVLRHRIGGREGGRGSGRGSLRLVGEKRQRHQRSGADGWSALA